VALAFLLDSSDVIGLDEYLEYVGAGVDLQDLDSVAASAPKFRALMNDRKLVTGLLNRQLDDWGTFQAGNTYTAQTFVLGVGDGFFVRANIWSPPARNAEVGAAEAANFSYLIPHDHNFTFMTGGYLGSGYRTSIWEYDYAKLAGVKGEFAGLRFLEHTSLPSGKIMVYRKSIDVHSQEHADEFSISLNLMIMPRDATLNAANQYIFDVEAGTIKSIASQTTGRVSICELAQHVGDSTTAGLFDSLSVRHPDPQIRAASIRSLVNMLPAEAEAVFERASRDGAALVRELGIAGLESGTFAEDAYQRARISLGPD
jgi:hypothetical protein